MLWTDERLRILRKLARKNSTSFIAEKLGVTKKQLTDGARKHNISIKAENEIHHLSKTTNDVRCELVRLIDGGLSISATSKLLGIPYRRAQYINNYFKGI